MRRASEIAGVTGGREATESEMEEVEFVLNTAEAVAQGMALSTALGSTTFRTRFLAMKFCPKGDPRKGALDALIDAAIRKTGAFVCDSGVFGHEELRQAHARETTVDGRRVMQFAVGFASDGRPIYPRPENRGPKVFGFRSGPPPSDDGKEVAGNWWEQLEDSER